MRTARAIQLAGGTQKALIAVFEAGGYPASKQTVSLWVKNGRLPALRIYQLREIKPEWFQETSVAKKNGKAVKNPKPRRAPANLASVAPPMKGTKVNVKGPPFRPGVNGDPDTKI